MKRLLYLFPLYILLLSFVPCKADDGCCEEEINAAAAQHQNNFPDNKPGLPCSPFFACGASHGFIIPVPGLLLQSTKLRGAPRHILYIAETLPDFPASVFQPPRAA
jgi:hypothetical protein